MTQELANKLIDWYNESIEECKKFNTYYDLTDVLHLRNIDCGLCCCIKNVFKQKGYGDKWIKSITWPNYPCFESTLEDIISMLQKRVNILLTFSEGWDKVPELE